MNFLKEKSDCCGCGACQNICPRHCIAMKADDEGFLYPHIDESQCVHCGLCKKACPATKEMSDRSPLRILAMYARDHALHSAGSSGGIFPVLAQQILRENGVVCGAAFDDDWNVKHVFRESEQNMQDLYGSKYVQSTTGMSYAEILKFLQNSRPVLFAGTPCQVAGLKSFLGGDHPLLFTVDMICHGVPSPWIWNLYLDELCKKLKIRRKDITRIDFREKSAGWQRFSFLLKTSTETAKNNVCLNEENISNCYMRGFRRDFFLRPSCHQCKMRRFRSGSDIKLGDFWGADKCLPHFYHASGISFGSIQSEKGENLFQKIRNDVKIQDSSQEDVVKQNGSLLHSEPVPLFRPLFFKTLRKTGSFSAAFNLCLGNQLSNRVKRRLFHCLQKVFFA